jgi:hypothetical protein
MATAATRRTTTAKASNVVDFDASRKRKRKGQTKPLRAFGREWQTKQANVTYLVDFEESEDFGAMFQFVIAHIVKSERKAFVEAMREDDDIDIETMMELSRLVQEAAYPDIPTTPS